MTKNADAVKIFKTRDSATSLLRKLGIQPRDYNFFIEKMADGRVACQVARAEMHLESLKNPQPKRVVSAPVSNPAPITPKKIGKPFGPNRGVSAKVRELILGGKTNQEIWEVLKTEFGLDDSKKHYPTWYRCEMKRKGLLK